MRRLITLSICAAVLVLMIQSSAQDSMPQPAPIEFTYPESTNTLDSKYFANSTFRRLESGKVGISVALKNGEGALHPEEGGSIEVELRRVYELDAEHVAVDFHVIEIGGSSSNTGYLQVFGLVAGHPILKQQISFDSDTDGTGTTFNSQTREITIRETHVDPDTCLRCSGKLDVIRYVWEGRKLVARDRAIESAPKR